MTKKKENFDQNPNPNAENVEKAVSTFVKIFILLLILDIVIIIFGMYCLFSSGLPWYVIIPVLVLMLTPAVGTAVALAVIVYHFATKHSAKSGSVSGTPVTTDSLEAYKPSPTYQFF